MENTKIGKFIAQQRKDKQMTQKQLGEALGISDKTISKWECGNGLPDISMIIPLCRLLGINVNELLSGEHLTQDTYPGKAEENMMNLMKDSEKHKKENKRGILACIAWILVFGIFVISLSEITTYGVHAGYYLDGYGIVAMTFILIFSLYFAKDLKNFGNAFVFLFHKAENLQKLEDAIAAVSLAEKSLLCSGAFCSVFYIICLLWMDVDNIPVFTANLGLALDTLLYGIFGVMVLTPVKGRLKKSINNGNL